MQSIKNYLWWLRGTNGCDPIDTLQRILSSAIDKGKDSNQKFENIGDEMSIKLSGGWLEAKVAESNLAGIKAEMGSLDNAPAGISSESAMKWMSCVN